MTDRGAGWNRWARALETGSKVYYRGRIYTILRIERIGYGRYAQLKDDELGSVLSSDVCVVELRKPQAVHS